MRRAFALVVMTLAGLGAAVAQTAAPSPKPAQTPKAKSKASSKPKLDFTGVWVLDAAASTNVSPQMQDAVLEVRQNGNRIWIEQIEVSDRKILSEQIVVDGKKYEKGLGAGQKGTLEAAWGNDGTSLWLQAIAGTEGDPASAVQRMIWRLRDGGKTWTRQTMTVQPSGTRETMLVFRKRPTKSP